MTQALHVPMALFKKKLARDGLQNSTIVFHILKSLRRVKCTLSIYNVKLW